MGACVGRPPTDAAGMSAWQLHGDAAEDRRWIRHVLAWLLVLKKKKEKKSVAGGRRVASTLRDLCVRRATAATTVFTLFFSAEGCNYRKLAEGSELGPSVDLFPEVRKCCCIFRSQLSTAKAWHGASKTLSENTTVILLQTGRQHNKVIFFQRRKEMRETPQK